jgi:hypothetical protein
MALRQLVFSSMWVNVMPTWQFKETTLLMAIFTVVIANGRLMHDDLFTVTIPIVDPEQHFVSAPSVHVITF